MPWASLCSPKTMPPTVVTPGPDADFVDYCHEGAYVLAKGRPVPPLKPLPDVLPFPYTGNTLHPTQKPVEALQPLIESFSAPWARLFSTRLPEAVRPASLHTVPDAAISASKCWRSTTGPEPNDWPPCTGPSNTPAANDEWLPEAA